MRLHSIYRRVHLALNISPTYDQNSEYIIYTVYWAPKKTQCQEWVSCKVRALAQSTKHDLAESQLSFCDVNNFINTSSSVGQNCQDFDAKSSFSSLAFCLPVVCIYPFWLGSFHIFNFSYKDTVI